MRFFEPHNILQGDIQRHNAADYNIVKIYSLICECVLQSAQVFCL
jgi:hypothetical protein